MAFLTHLSVFDWTEQAAEHYADIRAHLKMQGQMIGANDLMIAAHARSTSAANNEREFGGCLDSRWTTGSDRWETADGWQVIGGHSRPGPFFRPRKGKQ